MKKFIQIFIVFSIPVFTAFIWSFYLYKKQLDNLKIDAKITTIVCGDSHTESGINDTLMKNAANISQSSEHYLYTYNLLTLLLKGKSNIKYIVLGCSFHSFGENYDHYVLNVDKTNVMYPKYFSILDNNSKMEMLFYNPQGIIAASGTIYKNILNALEYSYEKYDDYPFYGKYYQSIKNNISDSTIKVAIERHYYNDDKQQQGFAEYQKKYLKKIVELCLRNNIKLLLINTPISIEYYNKIPHKFIEDYYKTVDNFKNKAHLIDLHSLPLDNRCFGDGDHLNAIGAKILTPKIDSIVAHF
jgi:hypothetical protein